MPLHLHDSWAKKAAKDQFPFSETAYINGAADFQLRAYAALKEYQESFESFGRGSSWEVLNQVIKIIQDLKAK